MEITVVRKSAAFLHDVLYSFQDVTGTIAEKSAATDYEFPVPGNWDVKMPNSKTAPIVLTVVTYSGDTEIGRKSVTAHILTDGTFKPQLRATIVDINEKSIALTGNSSRLIRGVSTARVTATAYAVRGASVKTVKINGVATEALEIEKVQDGAFSFSVTDSRGYETVSAQNLSMVNYVPLTISVEAQRAAQGSNGLHLRITGGYYSGSFGKEVNGLDLQMAVNGGAWQTLPYTVGQNGYGYTAEVDLELDYQSKHTIVIQAADEVMTLTREVPIHKAVPITMEGEDFFRVNVPLMLCGGVEPMATVPAGGDANNCIADGLYRVSSDSNAKSINNLPSGYAGLLLVFNALGETRTEGNYLYKTQVYISRNTGEKIKWRSMGNGDSGAWTFGQWVER